MTRSKYSADLADKILVRPSYTVHYRAMPPHRITKWHSDRLPLYSALFLLSGNLHYKTNYQTSLLNSGDALLINPGEGASASSSSSSTQAAYLALTLAPAFVLDCAVRTQLTRAEAHIAFRSSVAANDQRLDRLAADIVDELQQEEAGQEVVIAALVEQTVVHLLRHYTLIRRSDELELSRVGLIDRRIRLAVELMHAHLDQDLPLEDIAAAAYLSPFHFARLFKKSTGQSPHAYLATLRIAQAQILLADTDLSITQVSARVGYASSSHFTKAFRQATGLTPRLFRHALIAR